MYPLPPERIPASVRLWSLREDVLVEAVPDSEPLLVFTQWGEVRLDGAGPLLRESLQRMSLGPVSVDNLPILRAHHAPRCDGEPSGSGPWSELTGMLEQLGNCMVQSLGLEDDPGPVLSVAPVTRQAGFWLPPAIEPDRPVRLSRFAALRPVEGELVVESPVAQYRVVLHRPLASYVVGALAAATTVADLSTDLRLPVPVLADIVSYLVGSGVVVTGQPGRPDRFAEDDDLGLLPWSHNDLQFHSRSRMGRGGGPSGAVFPYAGRLPEPPVTRRRPDGPRFPLYRPAVTRLSADDPPLTEVIEVIEVSRADQLYSDRPVAAEEVGELLYRAARIRSTGSAPVAAGGTYTVTDRPYPSTAQLYELELYVSLDRCVGLPSGSYHYDPDDHALILVNDSEPALGELLDIAMVAAGSTRRPPALITLTTRIARLSWMYSGIAYATTLKHVGALQQTLHLVATAMGLASMALPVSDGELVDEALHLDWPTEVSVGEFLIGMR
jgi:SagB-type dehydrogenase family enzyme